MEDITWPSGDTKISLRVSSEHSEHFSTREEKFRIYKQPCNVLFIIHKHLWNPKPFHFCCKRCHLLCNHSNSDLFTFEDNSLFSCVKILCFHVKAHMVFQWFLCIINVLSHTSCLLFFFHVAALPFVSNGSVDAKGRISDKIQNCLLILVVVCPFFCISYTS